MRPLFEKSGLQQLVEHIQDDEEVSELLEDLQEAISDYNVRLSPRTLLDADKDNRWRSEWRSTVNR